jgi:hypothetical protein
VTQFRIALCYVALCWHVELEIKDMITDLWIENFKGISKRQHIPLRPTTLLFGANSAGKSTVLHALLYLREIICNHNPDPTKPLAGTQTVNLGGFWNLIHQSGGKRVSIATTVNRWSEVYNESHYVAANSRYLNDHEHIDIMRHRKGSGSGWACNGAEPPVTINVCVESGTVVALDYSVRSMTVFNCWSPYGRDVRGYPLIRRPEQRPWITSKTGWINPWATAFSPEVVCEYHSSTLPPSQRQESVEKAAARDRDIFYAELSENLESLYAGARPVDSLGGQNSFLFSASIFDVPTYPVEMSATVIGCVSRVVTLRALLEMSPRGCTEPDLSGLFVWLCEIDKPDGSSRIEVVGLLATHDGGFSIADAISLVRSAFFEDPLVVALMLDQGHDPILNTEQPLLLWVDRVLNSSEEVLCHISERQALIDELVRGSLKSLKQSLLDIVYVGPKRSTVPRTLNSDVMGEHLDWGDGLGAWNWMLRCSDDDFEKCGSWLGDAVKGLGTGFSLRRQILYEVEGTVLSRYVDGHDASELLSEEEYEQFQADLENARSFRKIYLLESRTNRKRHPQDVGEGLTQVIPVVAALVRSSGLQVSTGVLTGIEQPELHLHPSLAAKIGDLAVISTHENKTSNALIETHSEHLILRILRRIRQTTNNERPEHIPPVKPDEVCVLWVDNLGDGTTFQRLRIDDQGEFIDRWPKGFFSERAEELF